MSRYSNRTPLVRDNNGKPIVGAYTHFYEPGTVTYKTIYSDSDFSTPIANPVRSLAGGVLPTIFLDGIYKVVQNDEDDAFLWPSEDPVGEVAAGQFDDWLNDKSYSFNDIVKGSDLAFYKSLVAGIETNQGNDPISSPTEWGDATFATIDGTETLTNKTLTSPVINTQATGTAIKDEDDMSSDSNIHLSTQQAIKAYADSIGVKQIVTEVDVAYQTTTDSIPVDDTIPVSSEGFQLVSATITPEYADSVLEITFEGMFASSVSSEQAVVSIIDNTAGVCKYASAQITPSGNTPFQMVARVVVPSPGTSANTYRIRVGVASGTLYINGNRSNRVFGGVAGCRITIKEIR